jgi:hypothetical protein
MTNASTDQLSIVYILKVINRSLNVFPPERELEAPMLSRK